MCASIFRRLFGGSGRAERVAQITAQTQQQAALDALREAVRPVQDNEQARRAAEGRQRKLASMRGVRSAIGAGGRGDMGAPSVGLKVLMGQ